MKQDARSSSTEGVEFGGGGSSTKEQVKQQGQQALEQTQEAAGQVAGQAKDQVRSAAEKQKDRATETMSSVSGALRQTGQALEEKEQGGIGQITYKAADQVERATAYLQERDTMQLIGDLENYARRSPALVLGGAFALGLLAARFLKSSSESGGGSGRYGDYGYGDRYGGYQRGGYSPYPPSGYGGGSAGGYMEPGRGYNRYPEGEYGVGASEALSSGTGSGDPLGFEPLGGDIGATEAELTSTDAEKRRRDGA